MGRYRKKLVILIGSGPFLGAEHQGHGGAVNIQVHQAHGITQLAQRHRQVRGNGGFAHAALAGSDGDHVFGCPGTEDFQVEGSSLIPFLASGALCSIFTSQCFTPGKCFITPWTPSKM